jgi:transcriptional regulator with XRE-family HTH domain
MTQGDSPTVARRRVRLAIREAREAAKLTQSQVAEAMDWSLSKVIRIENGEVTVSVNDLRQLLNFIGIKDRAKVAELLAEARTARSRTRHQWHQEGRFRDHLGENVRTLIEYEAKAVAIRHYSIYFVPGTLQTPDYGAALLDIYGEEISPERKDALFEARRRRHAALLERINEVKLYLLLDESVLHRPIGGPSVFAAQLRELLRVVESGLMLMRMVPFRQATPITNYASFDLLSLDEKDESQMVLYYETGMTDELDESKTMTSRHRDRFDKVWEEAATEEDTIRFVRGRIEDLEATISNRQGEQQ